MKVINRGDKLFWARIVPCCGIYEVHDLHVRTVGKDYYVGINKHDKHAYLLGFNTLDNYDLGTEDFEEAVSKAKEVVMRKVKKIREDSYRFYTDNNIEFDRY